MTMKKNWIRPLAVAAVTAVWLYWLRNASGFRTAYWVVGLGGVLCAFRGRRPEALTKGQTFWLLLGAGLLSFAVVMANYNIVPGFLAGVGYFACGAVTAWPVFLHFAAERPGRKARGPLPLKWVFFGTMGAVCAVDITLLLNAYWPGVLSYDSIWQVEQLVTEVYSNHHPFYHTQIIRACYLLGMELFGDINKAICLYNVVQIVIMGAIFGFVMMTLAQRRVAKWVLWLCLGWYVCMPYHVMYSFTVWKDVLWSGMVTLFLTCLFRVYHELPGRKWNMALLMLGALGICLLRSNGWFVFVITTVLFGLFFGKQYPKIALSFLAIVAVSWVLKGPVLDNMGVTQPDTIESLSIPAQMIARVVDQGLPLTQEEYDLLSQVVDVERIPETYQFHLSDNIKELVREKDNQQAITENAGAYLKLWLGLGLRYPWTYAEAWIEQTRGYWNGGYDYWIWNDYVFGNDLGLHMHIVRPGLRSLWEKYLGIWKADGLNLCISVGFQTWIAAGVFLVSLAKRKWKSAFLAVPLLGIVASLMVATPVFCEFRYAYAFFTSVPVLLLGFFTEERT